VRHVPRTAGVLAALGAAASVWLYLDVRLGDAGLAAARPNAPWGPLVKVFPRFDGSAYPTAVAIAAAVAIALLFWRDARQWRRLSAPGWPTAAKQR
jgi:hypothetical protein